MDHGQAGNTGICIGASTVSLVRGLNGRQEVHQARHGGDPKSSLVQLLASAGVNGVDSIVVTGRKLRRTLGLPHVSEPAALQRALQEFPAEERPQAIVSFGGQTILVYEIDRFGQIINAYSPNKCGSGTGEFFLQQIQRLGFDSVEAALAAVSDPDTASKPYVPAKRCSVFCKSDCTHALNEKKATNGQVAAGLCKMIADKITELAGKTKAERLWVTGGGSQIQPVIAYLQQARFRVSVPPQARYLEAWGANLLAKDAATITPSALLPDFERRGSFPTLPPLGQFRGAVEFKEMAKGRARDHDRCLLAIDVGSTTTKAVLTRQGDLTILASYYGYTLGQPQLATVAALSALHESLGGTSVEIAGVVVTGSGRYLVETFLTDFGLKDESGKLVRQAVACNEITCHARAASHLNPGVSSVLEVGGQDAKYTFLVNGVPTDFCMNEACSAGTGSFLAEVVRETFGIADPREIAPMALQSASPIRFGDQCSAFIEGDIHTALQEGASAADVLAGLCYSVCFNYLNRVVGNRPVTGPISLQGGTAYNEAFCLAMAGVLRLNGVLSPEGKIVVNRDAGLLGALGALMELEGRIGRGEYAPISTTIPKLLGKRLEEGKSFVCQACDYHCSIRYFLVDGHKVPFGGFCRRYENVRKQEKVADPADHDWTMRRDELLFRTFSDYGNHLPADAPAIGVMGNFFELTYLPFLSHLFSGMGFRTVLADGADEEGLRRQGAAFCWPAERAHGLLANLAGKQPRFYWLPHLKSVENEGGQASHCCPFVQGSPYYLSTSFPELAKERLLEPYLDFSRPLEEIAEQLFALSAQLGVSRGTIRRAAAQAWGKQQEFSRACQQEGRKLLGWLAQDPARMAYVLFGRPYNAFSGHLGANKGISRKVASLGVPVVPLDFLPLDTEPGEEGMYWAAGQRICKGARYVRRTPQLFAIYLTNFSCGPDSFLNYRFREYMGDKPSLTLEFDGHVANAGFDTRVEAFGDIVRGYRNTAAPVRPATAIVWRPARIGREQKDARVVDSHGSRLDLRDPRVRIVIPDMGQYNAEATAATIEHLGIRSHVLPPADDACLQAGRRESSCKECLPYHLTLGSLLRYLKSRPAGEVTLYFMPDASGPCRFGQYSVFMRHAIERLKLENVAVFTLSPQNGYSGLGIKFSEPTWIALVTGAAMGNIANAAKSLARHPASAAQTVAACWRRIQEKLRQGVGWRNLASYLRFLEEQALELSRIPLQRSLSQAAKVLVTGEIYVRLAKLTSETVINELQASGLVAVQEPALNYIKYEDWSRMAGCNSDYRPLTGGARLSHRIKMLAEGYYEKRIYAALGGSGLLDPHTDTIREFIEAASSRISPRLNGEAILTVGSAHREVFDRFAGIVVLGPFGCMPTRIAGSILAYTMTAEEQLKLKPGNRKVARLCERFSRAPILFYETDGQPLPSITQAQLEVFSLVAAKVGAEMAACS